MEELTDAGQWPEAARLIERALVAGYFNAPADDPLVQSTEALDFSGVTWEELGEEE